MRCWLDRPAMLTHRSRGNDKTATCDVAGLTRHIMIVSLRSPRLDRSPNAPAYGELGSTQLLLSAPVIRKFWAPGSAAGNVGGGVVSGAGSAGADPVGSTTSGTVVTVDGSMIVGARLRSSITRWPAYRAPAAVKLAIAQRNAAPIVSR